MYTMIPLLPLFPFPLTWNPTCCDRIRPLLPWVARKLTLAFPPSAHLAPPLPEIPTPWGFPDRNRHSLGRHCEPNPYARLQVQYHVEVRSVLQSKRGRAVEIFVAGFFYPTTFSGTNRQVQKGFIISKTLGTVSQVICHLQGVDSNSLHYRWIKSNPRIVHSVNRYSYKGCDKVLNIWAKIPPRMKQLPSDECSRW